jgi:DNA polymerase-3 subunit alpha
MPLEKNIILVLPKRDADISGFLARAALDRYEVGVTWPKKGVDMLQEVCAADPKLVVQVGKRFSRRWPLVSGDGDWDSSFEARVRDSLADAFVGLHHHDEFSIKDGLGTVSQMIQLLKVQRRSFCCITNHGSIGGWVKQYNACRKAGVKAIFGMEAYVNNYRGDDPEIKKANRSANHLIVLAKNKVGFDNIIRIHNDAQLNGFYYDPRANWDSMSKWGEGVIGTSACMKGELVEALMADNIDKAMEVWEFYSGAFDDFYVELQILEFEMQREVNRRLVKFARAVDAPIILACDSHYLVGEHAETHDLLMMIRQGKTVLDKLEKEEDVWNFDVRNLYYRDAGQMEKVFREGFTEKGGELRDGYEDGVFTKEVFEEAMANTRKVALSTEDIQLDDEVKLPRLYPDSEKILREKINEGFRERELSKLGPALKREYLDRVRYEFEIITRLGWADYFLVMEYIVDWAIKEFGEWAVGYGRGSAAGSLVSYCLKLTDIDPMEHGLLFERFLDESRPDPPDIDTDFDPRIRDRVKDEIVRFFGEKNTCSIGTYQTYKTKAVILDVARALGLDIHEANSVTKKMDSLQSFENADGDEEKVDQMSFDDLAEHYPELLEYFYKYPEVLFHAEVLRNQVKNMGKHAGGVIISDLDLTGRIPVLRAGGKNNKGGTIISAWAESGSASELSSVGLVKFDVLGLTNLPVISDCIALIKKTHGIGLRRKEIPLDDREAIRMGAKQDLVGIFQFESPATKPIVEAVDMESLNDVSAITSLLRPGPKDMGMDMEYAERKKGKSYDMPGFMREALKDTYGVVTYQEQAMNLSKLLAGFTGPEANKLRKAIGKKIPELMEEMKGKFIKGSKKRIDAGEITESEVLEVWDLLESFAGYGFNKSHAVCYSAITTVELWLKFNYPVEYITALINNTSQGKKKHGITMFAHYINYARKRGFNVMAPDVNKSGESFDIEGKFDVRFSLGHVKNVASAAAHIVDMGPYESIEDFYAKCSYQSPIKTGPNAGKMRKTRPNKKQVVSLIEGGAFDSVAAPPGYLVLDRDGVRGVRNGLMARYFKVKREKGEVPDLSESQWQDREREVLGVCLSEEPIINTYGEMIKKEGWCKIEDSGTRNRVMMFGKITGIRQHTSKKGNIMFIASLSDGIDSMDFFVFQGAMQTFRDNYKTGYIAAIPMKKFEDSDTRFYDDNRCGVVLEK